MLIDFLFEGKKKVYPAQIVRFNVIYSLLKKITIPDME